ncbi:acyltransferase family protein [Sporolactobacillus sp. THM19-2]|uniref:acyltransferase family protein n=1 Tax=Sporolactobacillus sp. THM19-2 TaxID=2511171 RepID=UPI0013EDB432|nr:acyltransferase family protein [Sporolactobacillus sp. THM19-2]
MRQWNKRTGQPKKKVMQDAIHNVSNSKNVTKHKRRYMPGLDGLRAIAVFAVIFYHFGFPWASGGLLGVSIFFVLSGYLITDILLNEWEKNGRISLKTFWLRRARRLLPALFFILFVLFIWLILFRPDLIAHFRKDAVAAIFYVSNWWYIFYNVSYFDSFSNPSLLTHFWSLAVEEQFYLIWPLFLIIVLKFKKIRRHLFVITVFMALFSAVLMAFLYQPGTDPSRIYYGTDTRAFSILIGSALAMVWSGRKLTDSGRKWPIRFLDLAGVLAFILILILMMTSNEYDRFIYQGGMFLLSLASAAVIAACAHPSTWLGKFLGMKPLRWIGIRSYGMYLWQFPIIMLSMNNFDSGMPRFARFFVETALVIIVSTLSLQLIENPFRSGLVGRWFQSHFLKKPRRVRLRTTALTLSLLFLSLSCIIAWSQTRITAASGNVPAGSGESAISVQKHVPAEEHQEKSEQPYKKGDSSESKGQSQVARGETPRSSDSGHASGRKLEEESGQRVTAIGDSLMLDIKPYLEERFKKIEIQAKVGRQFTEAKSIVQSLNSQKKTGQVVIIELGTNGPVTMNQMHDLMETIDPKTRVILTTTRVPRPWEGEVNQTMRKSAGVFDNVRLADWYKESAGHPEYFAPDTIHLNETGSAAYANMLLRTVKSSQR